MPVVPATQEAEVGEMLEPGRWRLQLAEIAPLYPSWAWWCTPVVSATQEVEAGEPLEPGRRRLQ